MLSSRNIIGFVALGMALFSGAYGCGQVSPQERREATCKFLGASTEPHFSTCARDKNTVQQTREHFLRKKLNSRILLLISKQPKFSSTEEYQPMSVKGVVETHGIGSITFMTLKEVRGHPLYKKRVSLQGFLNASEPWEPEDKEWSYTISVHEPGAIEASKEIRPERKGEKKSVDLKFYSISLDIESLNRHERKFIRDNCDWPYRCAVTIYGEVDELEDSRIGERFTSMGIVIEHVNFHILAPPAPPWR